MEVKNSGIIDNEMGACWISEHERNCTSMNKPPRIGLVGAGMVSCHHLIGWADIAERLFENCCRLTRWEAA
jgi:hypothetical protein